MRRVQRQRGVENAAGVRRHLPLGRHHIGLAQSGVTGRGRPEQAQRLDIGVYGVVVAAIAQVKRRHHFEAAPVVGMLGEMRLDLGDGGGEVRVRRRRREPRGERHIRQAGGADGKIQRNGERRHEQQRRESRDDPRLAVGGLGSRAVGFAGAQQPASGFHPRALGVGRIEQALGAFALDFGQLLAKKRLVGRRVARGGAFGGERREHGQHGGAGEKDEDEPDHAGLFRGLRRCLEAPRDIGAKARISKQSASPSMETT